MSYSQAAQDIRTEIERARVAWTDYDLQVEIDNRNEVDLVALQTPYVWVNILWGDAQQLSLGLSPMTADYGTIVLGAGVKEGNGTSGLLPLLEHFKPYLQLRYPLGTVKTRLARIQDKPLQVRGYYHLVMQVPFWVEQVAAAVP